MLVKPTSSRNSFGSLRPVRIASKVLVKASATSSSGLIENVTVFISLLLPTRSHQPGNLPQAGSRTQNRTALRAPVYAGGVPSGDDCRTESRVFPRRTNERKPISNPFGIAGTSLNFPQDDLVEILPFVGPLPSPNYYRPRHPVSPVRGIIRHVIAFSNRANWKFLREVKKSSLRHSAM